MRICGVVESGDGQSRIVRETILVDEAEGIAGMRCAGATVAVQIPTARPFLHTASCIGSFPVLPAICRSAPHDWTPTPLGQVSIFWIIFMIAYSSRHLANF